MEDIAALGLSGGFTIFCCFFYIFLIGISLFLAVLWFVMLIDFIQRKEEEFGVDSTSESRIVWLLVLLIGGSIGAIAYYYLIYKKYPRK